MLSEKLLNNVNLSKLSRDLNISRQTIYNIINDIHVPSVEMYCSIAWYLGYDPAKLIKKELYYRKRD